MEPLQAVKGMRDILPEEAELWRFVENQAIELFKLFGYKEIRTPILEKTELFVRGIGDATDIVEKEMYTFSDSKGRSYSLRPEATASIIRAFIQNQLNQSQDRKFFLIGPMFRHERPQKGRYRQFHQINVEAFGIENSMIDAEIMFMATEFLRRIGIKKDVELEINTLGCSLCRPKFKEILKDYLVKFEGELCPDCVRRIHKNPLRCFDCKVQTCKDTLKTGPIIYNYICKDCETHFKQVMEYLSLLGVDFKINPYMVRGLDYYVRTAFEIVTAHLGAQNAVGGGGRYDGLMKDLGGPDLPGIGFALGMERIILLLEEVKLNSNNPDIYLILLGEKPRKKGFLIAQDLRKEGFKVEMDYEERSLKSQMRTADKSKAPVALIIGEDELNQGVAQIKLMNNGLQRIIELNNLAVELKTLLR